MADRINKKVLIDIQLQVSKARKKANLLTREIAQLEIQQKKYKKELKEVVEVEKVDDKQAASKAQKLRRVTTELKSARQNLNAYNKEINKSNQMFKQQSTLANSLSKAYTKMAGTVLAVMAAYRLLNRIIGGSIKAFSAFEKTLANVQTLLTHNEKTLKEGSIKVMKEYGFTIEDTNKAMFDAISAGIKATESIEFLHEASRLAVGGVTDLKTAVKGLVFVLNAYSLGTEHAAAVADAFYSAQKFGVTTVQELVEHIGRIVPIAKIAGVSFQEMLGSLASLTKGGLKTEEAVTILRQVIAALIKPAHQASLILKDAAVPTGILAVKTKGLVFALEQLNKAYRENPDAIARMIPNIRAFTGIAAFNTERLEELKMIINDVYNDSTSLTRAFNEQMITYQKQMEVFRANVKALMIEIGSRFKPLLTRFMNTFNAIVDNEVPVTTALRNINNELEAEVTAVMRGNFTLEERATLMEQINQEYAAYLPHLFAEEATLENIEKFMGEINNHLQGKILFTIYEQELSQIYAKQSEALEMLLSLEKQRAMITGGLGEFKGLPSQQKEMLLQVNKNLQEAFQGNLDATDNLLENLEEKMVRMAERLKLEWDKIKQAWTVGIAEDDGLFSEVRLASADVSAMNFAGIHTLAVADRLWLCVVGLTDGTNITLKHFNLSINRI